MTTQRTERLIRQVAEAVDSPIRYIFAKLDKKTVSRFIERNLPSTEPPTEEEWVEFQYKFLTAARRLAIRDVKRKFQKLLVGVPRPAKKDRGRPKRDQRKIRLIVKTIKQWLDTEECETKTEAVRKAKEIFKVQSEDTIWRYLRAGKQARRKTQK